MPGRFYYVPLLVILFISSALSAGINEDDLIEIQHSEKLIGDQNYTQRQLASLRKVEDILRLPEEDIDLATAKFIIESALDESVDVSQNLEKLDQVIKAIKSLPQYGDSSNEKMGAILIYYYTPGKWNNFQPYSYQFTYPFVKGKKTRMVSNLLLTKKGNCLSMPGLIVILGQRLGVNVNLAIAPKHAYARYIDAEGVTNIEATSGTLLRDNTYIQKLEISPLALQNAIYLQSLTKKETIAVWLREVGRHFMKTGQLDLAHLVADHVLALYPKYVDGMLLKGSIYYHQLQNTLETLSASNTKIAEDKKHEAEQLAKLNAMWFEKAESLGWQEPSFGFDDRYLQHIKDFQNQPIR